MLQNTDYDASAADNQAKAYRNRLNAWAITRISPDAKPVIVARFRTRSDADGYLRHLRQVMSNTTFEIIVDYQRDEAVASS
ncbi:hypothetical protein H6G33_21090 [Calothrix sp. FACHB-1219]|uniref:hypothetical protein n=1 Tax=unclassified Calothrix TaxID=2619626 RepID=UPI000B5EC945|nr:MULTISPECIES: hypothetical protein [unclassified Calothrix]MBD2206844.1 hypothetical protein [Calothrix sp. FACHB-168]MBD2219515.1 hypothetical protein [Calothrix sp. FACHB-1219]BAY61452.1 hypothetical protein NIES22_15170 [Calothrix brevissima NIES-22]